MKKILIFILANVLFAATASAATSFNAGDKVYYNDYDVAWWTTSDPATAFFFNQGANSAWVGVAAENVYGNYWSVTVPGTVGTDTWESVIFVRTDDAANPTQWYNQTDDLFRDGDNNRCYYLKNATDGNGKQLGAWGDLLWWQTEPQALLYYSNQAEEGVQNRDLTQFDPNSFDCTAAGDGTTSELQLGGTASTNFPSTVSGAYVTLFYNVILDDEIIGGDSLVLADVEGNSNWQGIENIFDHFTAEPSTTYGVQFWYKYEYDGNVTWKSVPGNYKLHFTTPASIPTSAAELPAAKTVKLTEYFTVSGQKASENFSGLAIKKTTYADGEVKTEKILK